MKIYSLTLGANTSVLINRKTFMAGDSATVIPLPEKPAGGKTDAALLEVTCTAIGPDYVLVNVAGEPAVRLLTLEMYSPRARKEDLSAAPRIPPFARHRLVGQVAGWERAASTGFRSSGK